MSGTGHLLLAGGGHSHALLLRHWQMHPQKRPGGWISLVNRHATALYSGLVPALIAGDADAESCRINLQCLCEQAQVSFFEAEIEGIDPGGRRLLLKDRPPLRWDRLSLDVGAISRPSEREKPVVPIKPLEPFLRWLLAEDQRWPTPSSRRQAQAVTVLGGGLAGVEVVLALRQRWPERLLRLLARPGTPSRPLRRCLQRAQVALEPSTSAPRGEEGPVIACTGSTAPGWLARSGLPMAANGRLLTEPTLQVQGHPAILASGDCAVIAARPRAPSGVWAVRAAPVLARNLLRLDQPAKGALQPWRPHARALQLLGAGGASRGLPEGRREALALWGPLHLGPHPWLWRWKQQLDCSFMAGFQRAGAMAPNSRAASQDTMACRGCAAKLTAASLRRALRDAGLESAAEDAHPVGHDPTWLQSVDGFPALLADPWRNARLTALHACSDLWACGARVQSAQAVITLPAVTASLQEELLCQTLAGLRAALEPIGGALIGGHSLESRSAPPDNPALGLQISLCVNGRVGVGGPWPKGGLQQGDGLILCRGLGSGVLMAAAMAGLMAHGPLSDALSRMETSQAEVVELMGRFQVHAATDITGFGLLGHLGEMLTASAGEPRVQLEAEAIPSLPGALDALAAGVASTLAPANREAWHWLEGSGGHRPRVVIEGGSEKTRRLLRELLVDPQTCGPLLLALPKGQVGAALERLHGAGFRDARWIGRGL